VLGIVILLFVISFVSYFLSYNLIKPKTPLERIITLLLAFIVFSLIILALAILLA